MASPDKTPTTPRTCQYCYRRRKSVFWHDRDECWYCLDIQGCEEYVYEVAVGLRPAPPWMRKKAHGG